MRKSAHETRAPPGFSRLYSEEQPEPPEGESRADFQNSQQQERMEAYAPAREADWAADTPTQEAEVK